MSFCIAFPAKQFNSEIAVDQPNGIFTCRKNETLAVFETPRFALFLSLEPIKFIRFGGLFLIAFLGFEISVFS